MVNRRVSVNMTTHHHPFWATVMIAGCSLLMLPSVEAQQTRDRLHEPVFRISRAAKNVTTARDAAPGAAAKVNKPHPLDPGLDLARNSLEHIERNIQDYTCTLVKRERVNGSLLEHEFMSCKVRHAGIVNGKKVPFSVYLNFLRPESMKGREVIYMAGTNDGKFTVHEGGFKGRFLPTVSLLPTSTLAMRNQRYPMTEIGIKTMTKRLIEKGTRDRKLGLCKVRMINGAKVKDRVCTMLEVRHDDRRPQFDFHLARVFLDSELNLPIRYEAYDWPTSPGTAPQLIEEYTYMNLKVNVGLRDADFDSKNPKYNF
ncbi:MAG: DUF1571 domain-containing protein [Pirellulaceae bacterium]|nr:DUF1571 domain-containing protein [Pirellulaceae bacterium]